MALEFKLMTAWGQRNKAPTARRNDGRNDMRALSVPFGHRCCYSGRGSSRCSKGYPPLEQSRRHLGVCYRMR